MSNSVKKNFEYSQLVSRNGFFIDAELQERIKNTTLLFIGCGLASSVAISATRLGFEKYILVDGDNVELTNLNRQDFYLDEIGENKAEVIANRIKRINSNCYVQVIKKYVGVGDIEPLVLKADIIINCADFNEVVYEIEKISSMHQKLSISPLNVGFGSTVTAFSQKSQRLETMTQGIAENDESFLSNLLKGFTDYILPQYIKRNIPKIFLFISKNGFFPQNIVASQTSNVLILNTIIRYLNNKSILLAPTPISFDFEKIYERISETN